MRSKMLFEILGGVNVEIRGEDIEIKGVVMDSRKVGEGDLFVARKGLTVDGHRYIDVAIKAGAAAVLCEESPDEVDENVAYGVVEDVDKELVKVLKNFFDSPSQAVNLVGVTGTNGKTTVTTLMYQLFKQLGFKVGLMSTVENWIDDIRVESTHTTPDIVELYGLLDRMRNAGCEYVFMEVSSHALDQGRVRGLEYDVAVFTNISHDHLDYHGSYDNYIKAKKKFFDELSQEAIAIVNLDDKNGKVMVQNSKAKIKSYALRKMADYKAKVLDDSLLGLHMEVLGEQVFFKMSGEFNAYNLLSVFATAYEFEIDKSVILQKLSVLSGAEGRFEKVYSGNQKVLGIVDYAHTPDALSNVLDTIKDIKKKDSEIITVVGCGGNRDKAKRPKMGRIAYDGSSSLIITSDNPRDEDPDRILDEMLEGLEEFEQENVLRIEERAMAIKMAVKLAKNGDVILVAGKGHEKTQEINGVKYPFDDKKILAKELSKIK